MTYRLVLSGLLFVGVLSSASPNGTLAYLTSATQSTGNQFTAGTLHIADSLAMGATLSMDNLIGGDNFDAQLDIANSGSLPLIYAVSTSLTSGSAALAAVIDLTVRAKTTNPCASRDGTIIYDAKLAGATIGSPAHGLQAGDRPVPAATTESLCFTVALPSDVSPSLSATNFSATFVFTAEQT